MNSDSGMAPRPSGPGPLAVAGLAVAGLFAGAVSMVVRKLRSKKTKLSLDDFKDVEFGPAQFRGLSGNVGPARPIRIDPSTVAESRASCGELLSPPAPPVHPSEREQAMINAADGHELAPASGEPDPSEYKPVCFACGKPMNVSKPFRTGDGVDRWDCNVYGGLELTTVGEYGSAYWDEDGMGTRLSLVICDECLENHDDRLHVRPAAKPGDPWPKPTTMREYNEKSSELYARWLDENGYELGEPIDMRDAVRMDSERAEYRSSHRHPADDSADRKPRRQVVKPFTWNDAGDRGDEAGDAANAGAEDHEYDDEAAGADGHAASGGYGHSMLEAVYGLEPGEAPGDLLLPGDLSRMCNDLPRDPVKRRCESSIEFYASRLVERNRESNELRERLKRLEREVRRLRGQKGRSGAR